MPCNVTLFLWLLVSIPIATTSDQVAKTIGISPMKVRKLLITAGVYKAKLSEEITGLYTENKSINDIAKILNMSFASVSSYLPYNHAAYKLPERSVTADSAACARSRKKQRMLLRKIFKMEIKGLEVTDHCGS